VVALMRHPTSYGPPRCRKLGTSRNRLTCLIICLPPYCLLVNYKRCMNIDIVLFRSHLKHLLLWPCFSPKLWPRMPSLLLAILQMLNVHGFVCSRALNICDDALRRHGGCLGGNLGSTVIQRAQYKIRGHGKHGYWLKFLKYLHCSCKMVPILDWPLSYLLLCLSSKCRFKLLLYFETSDLGDSIMALSDPSGNWQCGCNLDSWMHLWNSRLWQIEFLMHIALQNFVIQNQTAAAAAA
jgi:hypothetical protein